MQCQQLSLLSDLALQLAPVCVPRNAASAAGRLGARGETAFFSVAEEAGQAHQHKCYQMQHGSLSFSGSRAPVSAVVADKCLSCSASDAREAQAEVAILKRKLDARGRSGGSPTPGRSPRLGSPATGNSPGLHPAAAGNSSLRYTLSQATTYGLSGRRKRAASFTRLAFCAQQNHMDGMDTSVTEAKSLDPIGWLPKRGRSPICLDTGSPRARSKYS